MGVLRMCQLESGASADAGPVVPAGCRIRWSRSAAPAELLIRQVWIVECVDAVFVVIPEHCP